MIAFSYEIALSFCNGRRILRNRAKTSGASEREMEDGRVRQVSLTIIVSNFFLPTNHHEKTAYCDGSDS